MADEEGQEKTEEPTQRKLEQAAEKGQVPRSRELSSAILLILGSVGLLIYAEVLYNAIVKVFETCLRLDREALFEENVQVGLLINSFYEVAVALLPFLVALLVATIGASLMNGGWNLSAHPLMFNLSKLNPLAGLKRMFSVQSLVELLKSLLKFGLVSMTAVFIISGQIDDYIRLGFEPVNKAMTHGIDMVGWAFLWLTLTLVIVAGIDVPYQNWNYKKQLRMTKQEVKEEYKDSEGKPEIKSKQRQRAREIAFAGMMSEVPKADVVITNPTHYAVALKYDPSKMGAPRLVAKGADLIAEQIKTVAIANNVIILTAPPLARSIYYNTKIKREIPPGLYVAVAQLLAYVYHLKRFKTGQGPNPGTLPEVDVPPELRRD